MTIICLITLLFIMLIYKTVYTILSSIKKHLEIESDSLEKIKEILEFQLTSQINMDRRDYIDFTTNLNSLIKECIVEENYELAEYYKKILTEEENRFKKFYG